MAISQKIILKTNHGRLMYVQYGHSLAFGATRGSFVRVVMLALACRACFLASSSMKARS